MTSSGDQRTFLVMIFHKLDPLYIGLNILFHNWSVKVLYWGVEGDFSDLKCLHRISWSIALIFWCGALGRPICMLESGELSYYETKRIKWYVICGTFTTQTSTTASYVFNQVRGKVRIKAWRMLLFQRTNSWAYRYPCAYGTAQGSGLFHPAILDSIRVWGQICRVW